MASPYNSHMLFKKLRLLLKLRMLSYPALPPADVF
jgi:hypothetical protein